MVGRIKTETGVGFTGIRTISWGAVGNAATYRIYYATKAGLTKTNYATLPGGTLISNIAGTSANVAALTPGTAYYIIVTAINAAGEESVESVEVSATP